MKTIFEPLEPRLLLSADIIPIAAEAMADGIDQLGDSLDTFVEGEELLDTRLPFIVVVEQDGETVEQVAPTIENLMSVPVDFNGDEDTDDSSLVGNLDEATLEEFDTDLDDGDSNGTVDAGELLNGLFFDKVEAYLDDVEVPPDTTTTDFVAFLNNDLDEVSTIQIAGESNPTTISFEVSATDLTDPVPNSELLFDVDLTLSIERDLAIDLGIEADALKLAYWQDGTSWDDKISPKIPVTSTLEFGFTFGVRTGGQVSPEVLDADDFFIREADDINLSVTSEVVGAGDFDFNLNIGFLGAKVNDAEISYKAAVTTLLVDPDAPDVLGFTISQYGVEQADGVVTGANEIPSEDLMVGSDPQLFRHRF